MEKNAECWVVGVSGGADSMALLDMCYRKQMKIVVAHVNYQKRESANRDEKGVEAYCKQRGIPFFSYAVSTYDAGNFQAQARTIRYRFFHKIVQQERAEGVLVAHHLDDVLETYMMQKQRQSIPAYYGIKDDVVLQELRVKRLLLGYTKQELETYCDAHQVAYFIDESNATDDYTRNRIRHEKIINMSYSDKQEMVKEIAIENERLYKIRCEVELLYKHHKGHIRCEQLLSKPRVFVEAYVRYWVVAAIGHHSISQKIIRRIYQMLKTNKNWSIPIANKFQMNCNYGVLSIEENSTPSYSYTIDTICFMETPHFSLVEKGKKIEGVTLLAEDFPVTIRNYKNGDKIKLRYGTKKIARFFIDRKIPQKQRESWPVLVNNMGEIIFVCGIGCDILHYSNNFNMFVVK